jgi:serine/threonine protein kinase
MKSQFKEIYSPISKNFELTQIPEKKNIPKERSWEIDPSELTIEKEIGSGAYGIVYKGKWRGGDVAIKKMKENSNEIEIESFKSESILMEKLRPHRNIVQIQGIISQIRESLMIVTEFVEFGNLYNFIRNPEGKKKD